jgi:hypothetical protein
MRMICIVTGSTGMYEDRQEWMEGAYETREEADARAAQLNAMMDALGCHD